ncbi:hypothetical protein F3Y22_tig00110840pilonHSYRG00040 [Hibiscus syriacus]|uniref:Uncharacterized protein n=1 Tax=Hibiscus syriacus TaxID=106335 RepID=A0A6A2ZKV9_HIBSY|nr:hypothetical protein F3Y22_tig00110840pilonHSYRG00040 [Hibiscus syriacus]
MAWTAGVGASGAFVWDVAAAEAAGAAAAASPDGDFIDCFLLHHQPAFDHPQLKGQRILDPQERPSFYEAEGMVMVEEEEYVQLWRVSGERCPEGTIPMRRTREEDMMRASSVRRFGRKPRRRVRRHSTSNGHEVGLQHAVGYVNGQEYYRAKGSVNVWAPRVSNHYEFSLSPLWVISGSFAHDLNTIEAALSLLIFLASRSVKIFALSATDFPSISFPKFFASLVSFDRFLEADDSLGPRRLHRFIVPFPLVSAEIAQTNSRLPPKIGLDDFTRFSSGNDGGLVTASGVMDYSALASNKLYDLWHRRLGHPAHGTLERICKSIHIVVDKNLNEQCVACHMGKSHRLPFTDSDTVYTTPFQLIFTDLWGLSPVVSNGYKYYVDFVDAYTRHTWLYLLKDKSQTVHAFQLFQQLVSTQSNSKIQAVQSDWGGEYRSLSRVLLTADVFRIYALIIVINWSLDRSHARFLELVLNIEVFCASEQMVEFMCLDMLNLMSGSFLLQLRAVLACACGHDDSAGSSSGLEVSNESPSTNEAHTNESSQEEIVVPTESAQRSTDNHHPMLTRSKCGVYKPKAYSSTVSDSVPANVHDALLSPDWAAAINAEYSALVQNKTWSLVEMPRDKSLVGCKWLFKLKKNADGSVHRYKARLVAKGFSQVPGHDSIDTFSLVVKFATVYVVLAIAVAKGWSLIQIDVDNAFLNGDLAEDVYIRQPPGFEQFDSSGSPLVCKLNKALYGLRQTPQNWNEKLKNSLLELGFTISRADASLFVRLMDGSCTFLLVYVDDIIITGNSDDDINAAVRMLNEKFSLKDLGELSFFLGIEVKRKGAELALSQKKYILELLERTDMLRATPTCTPMIESLKGSNIAFSVNRVAQFMQAPCEEHMVAVKRILRYLAGAADYGLLFSADDTRLCVKAFSDADWAGDAGDRRSMTGYGVFLGNNLVTWVSKKQKTVSRSTMEAEYRSITEAAAEVTWVTTLLSDLGVKSPDDPVVWCDNTSAVALSANPVYHAKSKHVDLDIHFVREKVAAGCLRVSYVPTGFQLADGFTKPLTKAPFQVFRDKLHDPKHGNWWLEFGSGVLAGYWPACLFTHLRGHATMVQFGGEIVYSRARGFHTSTAMGSGHFSGEGFRKASYFRNLQVVDWDNNFIPLPNLKLLADHPNCYDIRGGINGVWGHYFYYGGPGRNVWCP